MPTPLKFDTPLSTAILVRLTDELHELVRQAAADECCGLADFMRDAAIFRLGQLGLVPTIVEDDDDAEEAA